MKNSNQRKIIAVSLFTVSAIALGFYAVAKPEAGLERFISVIPAYVAIHFVDIKENKEEIKPKFYSYYISYFVLVVLTMGILMLYNLYQLVANGGLK